MVEVKLTQKSVAAENTSNPSTVEDTFFSQVADVDSSEDVSLAEVLDAVAIEANADEALAAMDAALSSEHLDEILVVEFTV